MAKYIHETLSVDEVWLLLSVNWQKDASKYASLEHRMEMGRIMARHYPDTPLVISDIEESLGTHYTSGVLKGIQEKFPDDRFIWVMGADNLASFHTWEKSADIIENFPIAIVDRPGYAVKALQSYTALSYPHLQITDSTDLATRKNGWAFMNAPLFDVSSSNLLNEMRAGKTVFGGPFQDVADYILKHELYGIKRAKDEAPQLRVDARILEHSN